MSSYSNAKIVGFITILIVLFILIFISFKIVSSNREKQKEESSYLVYTKEDVNVLVNGDFLEYVSLNDSYKEKGVSAFYKGENISSDVTVSYFNNNEQVFYIDTTKTGNYLVKYTIIYNGKTKDVYKTVIVIDNKKPVITFPKKTIITVDEVNSFDLEKDVIVKDNSGSVKLDYDNPLESKKGKYIVTYTAIDGSNNKQIKKRIIEVK